MTTLDFSAFNTMDAETREEMSRQFNSFLGRTGQWAGSPPGLVAREVWSAVSGNGGAFSAPTGEEIVTSHLTRKELSSLARMLDVFAREQPNTYEVGAFVLAIVADDAAAQTDPHAPRLFDM